MIGRVWRGWTTIANAEAYEHLLRETIFPRIESKQVAGYKAIELFRRAPSGGEVEFMTIMWFDSWDAVRAFAGEEYETAYVPTEARSVLRRFDERSQHYEIRDRRSY